MNETLERRPRRRKELANNSADQPAWQVVLVDLDKNGIPGEQFEQLFLCEGPDARRNAIMRSAGYNQPVDGQAGRPIRIAVPMQLEASE